GSSGPAVRLSPAARHCRVRRRPGRARRPSPARRAGRAGNGGYACLLPPAQAGFEADVTFAVAVVDRTRPGEAVFEHASRAGLQLVHVPCGRNQCRAVALLRVAAHRDREAVAEVAVVAAPQLLVDAQPYFGGAVAARTEIGRIGSAAAARIDTAQAVDHPGRPGGQAMPAGGRGEVAPVAVVIAQLT